MALSFYCARLFRMQTKMRFVLISVIVIAGILMCMSLCMYMYGRNKPGNGKTTISGVKTLAFGSGWFDDKTWPIQDLSKCKNKNCAFTKNNKQADAVIFHSWNIHYLKTYSRFYRNYTNRHKQAFVLHGLESEANVLWSGQSQLNGVFNWTATYRLDSDFVIPYARVVPLKRPKKNIDMNLAKGKSKMVLAVISNCWTKNRRLDYIRELQKYIDVDLYGRCGRKFPESSSFRDLGRQYKFYLAFENSKCEDYITEKFWINALDNNMLPVVSGATKLDYLKVAPLHSFIHTDDYKTIADLAAYLKQLDKNDTLYNEYFRWKQHFEIEKDKIMHTLYCSVCEALHDEKRMKEKKVYNDLAAYWNANTHCVA